MMTGQMFCKPGETAILVVQIMSTTMFLFCFVFLRKEYRITLSADHLYYYIDVQVFGGKLVKKCILTLKSYFQRFSGVLINVRSTLSIVSSPYGSVWNL